jgi:hypothetical protein
MPLSGDVVAIARLRIATSQPATGLDPDRWYTVLVRAPRQVPEPTKGTLWLDLQVSGNALVSVRADDVEVRTLGAPVDAATLARLAGRVPLSEAKEGDE